MDTQSWPEKMPHGNSGAAKVRVWMRSPRKPFMVAEGERNLEWIEEEGNDYGFEISCNSGSRDHSLPHYVFFSVSLKIKETLQRVQRKSFFQNFYKKLNPKAQGEDSGVYCDV